MKAQFVQVTLDYKTLRKILKLKSLHISNLKSLVNIQFTGAKCSKNTFSCDNGKCISMALICDGKNDCIDTTDETIGCTSSRIHEI